MILTVFLLIPIIFLVRLNQSPKPAAAGWWNDSWGYRVAVNIGNSSGSNATDIPVNLSIGTSALIVAGKMQSNCADLRITDNKGKLIPYFISNCNEATTYLWAKTKLLTTSGTILYLYYGNPNATSVSSAKDTFDLTNETITSATSAYSSLVTGVAVTTVSTTENGASPLANYMIKFTGSNDATVGNHYAYYKTTTASADYLNSYTIQSGDFLSFLTYSVGPTTASMEIDFTDASVLRGNHPDQDANDIQNSSARSNGHWYWRYFNLADKVGKTINRVDLQQEDNTPSVSWTVYYTGIQIKKLNSSISVGATQAEESSAGPVAYWKFDEGVGTSVYDDSPNKINGGFGTGNSYPTWAPEDQCISGKCLFIPSVYKVATNKTLALPNQFTISNWVRTSSGGNQAYSISNAGGGNGYRFGLYAGKIGFLIGNAGGYTETTCGTTTVNDNKWHLITGVFKSSDKCYCYIDGKFEASVSIGDFTGLQSNAPVLGGWSGAQQYTGYLDEIKIYAYARTLAQIQQDYNAGKSKAATSKGSSVALSTNKNSSGAFSEGLVGYWKLDENVGTTSVDSSGNNYTATFGTGSSSPAWSNGKYGVGLSFNGSISYAASSAITYVPVSGKTGCAWVYPLSFPSSVNGIIRKYGSSGMSIRVDSTGHFSDRTVNTAGTNSSAYTSPTGVGVTTWSHVCATWEAPGPGQNIKLRYYVNGRLDLDVTTDISDPNGYVERNLSQPLWIGNDPDLATRGWNGYIDEVRLYNRTLSPTEISQIYNFAPGPTLYWNFNESTGTSAFDTSGNNFSGTLKNTPSWTTGRFGNALNFNGSNTYISGTNNSSVQLTTATVEAWIKTPDAGSTYRGIVTKQSAFGMFLNSNVFGVYDWGGGGIWKPTTRSLNDNLWHHVAFSFQNGITNGTVLYIDGVAITQVTTSVSNQTTAIAVGAGSDAASQVFTGNIDDVRVYNYVRTNKQITEDMNAGHPLGGSPVGSQLVYYKFDEGYGMSTNNWGNLGSSFPVNLGTAATIPTWTNDGKFSKALYFGANSLAQMGSTTPALEYRGVGGLTLSAWIKADNNETDGGQIISKQWNGSGKYNYWIKYVNNQTINFQIGGSTSYNLTTTQTIPKNEWHYIAATVDGTTQATAIYVDGKLSVSGTNNVTDWTVTYSPGPLVLGCIAAYSDYCRAGTSSAFNGSIDEVKLYYAALTDDEIKIDYNNGKSIVMGSLSSASTGNTNPPTSGSQEYCVPGDSTTCAPPVGRWDFQEGTGTSAYDTSGNANHGRLYNSPTWTQGKVGQALKTTGNQYIDVGTNSSLNITGDATYEGWVKLTATTFPDAGTNWTLFSNDNYLNYGSIFRIDGASRLLYFRTNQAGASTGVVSTSTLNNNTWYYLVAVKSGSNLSFYINGVKDSGGGAISNPVSSAISMTIGNNGQAVNGLIDQFRIFNYARTPAQIAWDYNRGKPVGWWKLDECQGTTIDDWSMNGNTGTLSIGASGTQNSVGTCSVGTSAAWTAGATGKFNSSLNFDGSDDYINIGSTAITIGNDFTISTWTKTVSSLQRPIISNRSTGRMYFGIASGKGFLYYSSSSPPGVSSLASINDNTWHHLLLVRSGTTSTFYIDGKFDSATTQTGYVATASPINIGFDPSNVEYYPGLIDDVRIYNYALTAEQVKQVFNNGSVVTYGPATGSP